ncbi:lysylphosphatidylglycerol synthase domain-containing protein [Nitrospirillum sp. BR 11752]|uniref:lysylphosphatidylglycerol synthase domain-containing protein n=1 Tax=Nitrospirillum sp. BR 11752 TaxID=3104293 RepID=UPI002EC26FCF|nr:lysylphosphatidylglycerol synthase domain-containing protein [Nitrospirillum sp. BR 11752]
MKPSSFSARQGWLIVLLPPAALAAYLIVSPQSLDAQSVEVGSGWLILAIFLYALAHVVRALRLAIIAAPVIGGSARTMFLLHFQVTPVSFSLPFKLGDIYRLQQLGGPAGEWARALLVILVERMMDAFVLSALCLALFVRDSTFPPNLLMIAVVLSTAIVLAMLVLVAAGPTLTSLQKYLFRYHISQNARIALRIIVSSRRAMIVATGALRGNLLLLILLSIAIWCCEWGCLASLVSEMNGKGGAILINVIAMALSSGDAVLLPQTPGRLYLLVALAVMALTWPVATYFYLKRLKASPRRLTATGVPPLSVVRLPRRVRFNVPRAKSS